MPWAICGRLNPPNREPQVAASFRSKVPRPMVFWLLAPRHTNMGLQSQAIAELRLETTCNAWRAFSPSPPSLSSASNLPADCFHNPMPESLQDSVLHFAAQFLKFLLLSQPGLGTFEQKPGFVLIPDWPGFAPLRQQTRHPLASVGMVLFFRLQFCQCLLPIDLMRQKTSAHFSLAN